MIAKLELGASHRTTPHRIANTERIQPPICSKHGRLQRGRGSLRRSVRLTSIILRIHADFTLSYEGDDAAPSASSVAAAPAAAAPEPAAAVSTESAPPSHEHPPASDAIANGSNAAVDPSAYANEGWNDQQQSGQQNWDYSNNNQGNDFGAAQQNNHNDDDYKPIGIKEDG